MLTELLDKAQTELDDARYAVTNVAHNFAMLTQSIEDQLAQAKKALEKDKADKSELATALVVEKPLLQRLMRVWHLRRRLRLPARALAAKWPLIMSSQ